MTDKESIATEINKYMNLLRIIQAEDKLKEANNQLRESRAKLEAYGVTVEDLHIE